MAYSAAMPRIGSVSNDYSNYLAILVADGDVAAQYRADDFERASKAENKKEFAIGTGKGVVVEIGGCGSAEVHRLGTALVVPEIYTGDDDVDAEAALDRAIAMHPTTKPKLIGTVDVKSGVIVLMGLLESGSKKKPKSGSALTVPKGRYDVWRETFRKEVEGAWGTMPSRVRVVPHGTKLAEGKPIFELAPSAPAAEAKTGAGRRLVDPKDKWQAIQSLAIADDGRTFAGENGAYGVAAWDANGKLLWQRAVRPRPKKPSYEHSVHVALAGNDLLALCKRELEDSPTALAFTADGKLVTVDDRSRIKLWDPKSGKQLAQLDGAKERSRKPNGDALATSARHIALGRDDGAVAVLDPKTKKTAHLFEKHLVAIPGTGATEIGAIAFTKDGKTLWVSAGLKGAPVGLTAYDVSR